MKCIKIYFVTGNKGKFSEIKDILAKYDVEAEHIDKDKPEIDSEDLKEIATYAAKKLAKELGKTVVIEDTGLYFKAFNNFPGTRPKFVYKGIGLKGILKLLEGENREAYFMTIAAIGWPDGKVKLFEGKTEGRIAEEIKGKSHEQLPYDSIFIPEGYDKVFAEIMDVKRQVSHRVKAFEKVGEYLSKNTI